MNRFVCIHGHFYQPPRENAWLESIEIQLAAYPYHDWNERITAECYLPNSASRILDSKGRIIEIVSNYSKMSFDFGPTLLSWMEKQAPDVYHAILKADRESQQNFSGHGSALAHAYNHVILPLANQRDKYTQILWGIRDFEYRFARHPEGMWLPETAVDLDTLNILAELGIKFTILAPRQAGKIREIGREEWLDIDEKTIDTSMPYKVNLSSGREIVIFFYNGYIATSVAFQDLLNDGKELANRLIKSVPEIPERFTLAHIATDGESYGHHHRFGDMALAYALRHIENTNLAKITDYGEFLEKQPPTHEVQVLENTSWSCSHGIERWRTDCGCSDHYNENWNQIWRTPLRNTVNWLRDYSIPWFEDNGRKLFINPWEARNDYISVILERSPENITQFLNKNTTDKLTQEETVTALKLMELQRYAMLMYTSCGWFFDDLARIESVQVIQYAGRVAQLLQEISGSNIENKFLNRLAVARSNDDNYGDGIQIYQRFIKPTFIDLKRVAAHFAMSSFFKQYSDITKLYCYEVRTQDFGSQKCDRDSINYGRIKVTSLITTESADIDFISFLRDNNTVTAGIRLSQTYQTYTTTVDKINAACEINDNQWIEQFLITNFKDSIYTFNSLFRDTQYDILANIMESSILEMENLFYPRIKLFSSAIPLVDETINPLPEPFFPMIHLILHHGLYRELKSEEPDIVAIQKMLDDAQKWHINLDSEQLGIFFNKTIENTMKVFVLHPEDTALLNNLIEMLGLIHRLPFSIDVQRVQNLYYLLSKTIYQDFQERLMKGDYLIKDWVNKFEALGELLSVAIE